MTFSSTSSSTHLSSCQRRRTNCCASLPPSTVSRCRRRTRACCPASVPPSAERGRPRPNADLHAAAALVFVEDLDSLDLCQDDAHHLGEVLRLRAGEVVVAADGSGGWRSCASTSCLRPAAARWRDAAPSGQPLRTRSCRPGAGHGTTVAPARGRLLVGEGRADRMGRGEDGRARTGPADAPCRGPDSGASRRGPGRPPGRPVGQDRPGGGYAVPPASCPRSAPARVSTPWWQRVPACDIAICEPGGAPISLATPVVLVGPEGGWSERELALVAKKVALGDGMLRVETAALAAGALLTALRSGAL